MQPVLVAVGETKIGKKGWMNVFSFHTMKLMTTLGEGGMITTDDAKLAKLLPYIHRRTCELDRQTPRFGGNGETIILYLVAPING